MASKVLTIESAKSAGFPIIENGKHTQALHDAVVAYRAARRSGSACTKTKADVNLSGAKPWRQKGTGRARAGYKSSPVWVGGGVVFGPKPRDYRKKLTKTVKAVALNKAISLKVLSGDVVTVERFEVAAPKTKEFVKLVSGVSDSFEGKSILVVASTFTESTYLAGRNVGAVQLIRSSDLNAEDVLKFQKVLLVGDAVKNLVERLNS